MKRRIRIAVPSKGRLRQPSIQVMQRAGINILEEERVYISETTDPRFEVVFVRTFDVPLYVQFGAVDLGITGHDLILEREADVHELSDLGFGKCRLVVAVPAKSTIYSIDDISEVSKVATEYPNLTRKYFEGRGKQVEILRVRGTTELAPKMGLAEIIVDISSTGETLHKNNLKAIATILHSTARLACNKIAFRILEKEINEFVSRLA
jgi:ATP phosphoribosyltransferase